MALLVLSLIVAAASVQASPAETSAVKPSASFWSFQAVQDPPIPEIASKDWSVSPVDRFIASQHTAKHLKPAPQSDKRTLLRRATFDLTGLPPTVEEMNAFLADNAVNAFEKIVDRLLASQAYGEKWGRHWLDLSRYADQDHLPLAKNVDCPITGLLEDLKSGGMLDDTLMVWTTEFGRTPVCDSPLGRGHHAPVIQAGWREPG